MGRTNRKLAAIGLTAGFVAAAGTGVAMAEGGITANLALSGTIFTVSIGDLVGEGFSLFVGGEELPDGTIPAARLRFAEADASDLCVSAPLPGLPGAGDSTFVMKVPGAGAVHATDLVVGATVLRGDLSLTSPSIGIDASQVDDGAPPGSWGIHSRTVNVQAQEIRATSIGATTLSAAGFDIAVRRGLDGGC